MSYSSEVLADSPLAYYKLDETTGTTMGDSSGNSRPGTYSGATLGAAAILPNTAATSAVGGTSGQGVGSVADAAWMDVSALTVEVVVKPSNTSDVRGLVSRYVFASGAWLLWQRSGRISFLLNYGSGEVNFVGPTLIAGRRYHIACTYNGSSVSFYVDGVLYGATTAAAGSLGALSTPIQIGGYAGANYAQAGISDVAIYGTALSADRLWEHAAAARTLASPASDGYSATVLTDAPVAYYRLGEAVPEQLLSDSSGNARHGVYMDTPTLGVTGPVGVTDTALTTSSAGHAEVRDLAATSFTSAFSVEAWHKPNGSDGFLVEKYTAPGASGFAFRIEAAKPKVYIFGASTSTMTLATAPSSGNWHHYVFTHDGTNGRIYVDGALALGPTAMPLPTDGVSSVKIGARGDDGAHQSCGVLDEMALYTGALSATRVLAHYTAGTTAPPTSITGTVGATLPPLTGSATGTVSDPPVTGVTSVTLPALTAAVTGTHTSNNQVGTVAATLPALTGSAAGTFTSAALAGSVAATLPALTGLISGTVAAGVIPPAADDGTVLIIDTDGGELDTILLDPTPPGMVQRPLWRRSVTVPRLRDIPGVIIDPVTLQPRIPAAVYATFPVIEEEVGVPHVIFPGRDGVHDMTYYRRNRARIVSTRAEEPFGDTSAQVEFPQITSMDDDPDGLTSPHPWTKIRANMEVVWRKSDGSIRRHWAGNVFSRNVGNDGKSPFLRITALGSLRMAGNAINKPLNRQDPLDLGTIIPRTLNGVVSRRYNAVPHVTTGILSKKRGSWSDSALGFVQDCLADAWTVDGNQWTIAKIPSTRRAYEMRLKKTAPSWTITNGAMGVGIDLNKDGSVRNVIYGHGVRDDGGMWRNTFYFDGTDPNDGIRLPLAADPRTQKRILHPSGLGMMDNPDYDENIPAYEDDVDFGQCSVAVAAYSAQQIVDRESIPSLSGRITLRTDPREGSRAFILAGDKTKVLGYEGRDVVLHIAAFEMNFEDYEVTLDVAERSHDALTLAQIRSLQKDARRDPAMRPGNPNRRSRLEQDQTPPFDAESIAGIIQPRTAPGGQWSGQAYPFAGAGRIVKTHFEAGSPFAVIILAKPTSAAHLASIVGNPLTKDNPFEPHLKVLENTYGMVACWGQKGQRMGYSPGREDSTPAGAFTGDFDEYSTWEYVSGDGVKLWVYVFPQSTTTFSGRCYPGSEL